MVTDEQKAECLTGFVDFLVDSSLWPERNSAHTQEQRNALKETEKAMKHLEKACRHQPNHHLLMNAQENVREAIRRFKQQVPPIRGRKQRVGPVRRGKQQPGRYRWEGSYLTIEEEPKLGNIQKDRMLFTAYLIFKKARSYGWLRPTLCPRGSAIDCMAEYVSRKGCQFSPESLSRAISRYKKKRDIPPEQVVSFLYSHYVWVRKGQRGFSDDERKLLLELTSKLGPSRRKLSQRSK